jgi:hypothetical protein
MNLHKVLYPVGLVAALLLGPAARTAEAARTVLPLDGTWSVAESVAADAIPATFDHTVAVPGLTDQAKPPFADVDQFETYEHVQNEIEWGLLPRGEKCDRLGRTRQKRNYFWYERTFPAPARRDSAVLVVDKAQFGTAVWLNGKKIGEHLGCFTAACFDVAGAIHWQGENRLVIRIGAHPGALPDWAMPPTDIEKGLWTPGIYDRVSLLLADAPVIETIQVAPQIRDSTILVQTRLRNPGPARIAEITCQVKTWKGGRAVGPPVKQRVELAAGDEKTVTQSIAVPNATLWCPEDPFLYVLETSTGGDSCTTRFGMREFHFDTASRRAWLNGKIIYLRGSSITLHRFFGDPQCAGLPWDEAWVRKFLIDIPHRMHWNAFRLCIGPPPQQWLDIADEAGLLLQYEAPIWIWNQARYLKHWNEAEVISQFKEFVRDNWNHPSVVLWDASNETFWTELRTKVIPAVRGLDLSNRPWEDGYNGPQGPDDPFEDHPYFLLGRKKPPLFPLVAMETGGGWQKPIGTPMNSHACIINEYDALFVRRDGRPTLASQKEFDYLLGPKATSEQRFMFSAYALAGLTEYWRAYRNYAGVMYLTYLDGDVPQAVTCDNFRDIQRLVLDPYFADYVGNAFKPLGVYVNFWQPELPAGGKRSYRVIMVNDTPETARGRLDLVWESVSSSHVAGRAQQAFDIPALGQATYDIELTTPIEAGPYQLKAQAFWDGKSWSPTVARRKVTVK